MSSTDAVARGGYFGVAHRDTPIGSHPDQSDAFKSRFKHALLFAPKLILADHMVFSPNFLKAYKDDREFRALMRDDLIEIAHFERFSGGRALTLVELRKFHDWLRKGQADEYHPTAVACPASPIDDVLDAIQGGVGRQYPNSSQRDPIFTRIADQEFQERALEPDFGEKFYTIYEVAYRKMRSDLAAQNAYFGIIHFDEKHKTPGHENIFDYMAAVSSIRDIPRALLVDRFAEKVSRAYRTMLIKAEIELLSRAYAILPPDLAPYRSLVLANVGGGRIDEREANIREQRIDLAAVNTRNLAALSVDELLEIRRSGNDFFEVMASSAGKPEDFNLMWSSLTGYCAKINDRLSRDPSALTLDERVTSSITLIQGKIARHSSSVDTIVGSLFKVVSGVTHSATTVHAGMPALANAIDHPLKIVEDRSRDILKGRPLDTMIRDVNAKFAFAAGNSREQLMEYR